MKNNYLEPIVEVVKFSPEDIHMASSEIAPSRETGAYESEEIPLD